MILDSAVGAIMEEVDLCLVGAEAVMENGGIVNKVCGVVYDNIRTVYYTVKRLFNVNKSEITAAC